MFKKTTWLAAAALSLGLPVLAGAQTTVNFATTFQTIRGFGGAEAWMPQLTTAQLNALFGNTGSGELGLSILRLRIDPSSTTGGSNWATELANAQGAHALGATVIATPWTPPAAWKSSNSTVEGTLNTSEYGAYASYLNSFTAYLAAGGVPLYAISMQNEPDANVTYESCVWTGATMDTWVANNSAVLTTKLIMPESESFVTSLSDPALDDANAVGKIGIIAGHIYGVQPSYYTNAENKGKEVWMTEHYLTPSGSEPAIGDAIAAATEVYNSMVTAQYNAYVWWWLWDWNPGGGNINYGLIDTNSNPTYYGYAVAQYSKFVPPGSVRVSATGAPSGVLVSAYKGSAGNAIVAVNSNSSAVSFPVSLENLTVSSVTPYQTTSAGGLQQQSAVTVTNGSFTYTLPGQSIVTFVTPGTSSTCSSTPPAPTGLTATASSSSAINLSWTATTAPSGCSISAYKVFRSTTSGFTPSTSNQIASVASGTTFGDTGLSASTTYYYVIEAVDSEGSSTASAQASAETEASTGGSFTLAPSASSLPVTQGTTATDTITVTDTGGFSGAVTLAVSGLPSGVTAAFGTNPTTGSSIVTFTASSSATVGTAIVTIVGTSGTTTANTSITLTVNPATTGNYCHVIYAINNQWPSGFGAAITLENTGTTNWTSWTLTWSFANGQTITQLWNGAETQSGANVTVSNLSYNGSISAGGSYNGMGFNGSWNNSTNSVPTAFAVNGHACN